VPILIGLAAAPSCLLMMDYFERTEFFKQGAGRRLIRQPLALLNGPKMEKGIGEQLQALDQELFRHHVGTRFPLSICVGLSCVVFAAIAVGERCCRVWAGSPMDVSKTAESVKADDEPPVTPSQMPDPGWLFPLVFGLFMLGFYLFLPDDLGRRDRLLPHGGFLKARLALLPPLFWLACLREPVHAPTRLVLRALTLVLLGVNLFLVVQRFHEDNTKVEQFTAGLGAVGRRNRIMLERAPEGGGLANPLLHAADYYGLGTDNIILDNYEASTSHFPVKYRAGVMRGRTTDADVMIDWRGSPKVARPGWDVIFTQGSLRIFRRQGAP
jgi:hypothetical protein